MKKSIIIGATSLALAAVPIAGVFADFTDTVNVTINESCTLTREAYASGGVQNNPSHKNGTGGTWSTTAGTDTLNATMTNGTVQASLGSSQFKVVCNRAGGYKVTVATTSLSTGGTSPLTIPNNTTYSASVSGWSPVSSGTKLTNGGTVNTVTSPTAGTTFEVSYGVGVSTSQAAGTYTGTATYSLTGL